MRNLHEQVKKAFCYQKLFWPFTVWINRSSDLKNFANSLPSASNFKSFSRSPEQPFLTVGQNNFGNKIPDSFFWIFFIFCFADGLREKEKKELFPVVKQVSIMKDNTYQLQRHIWNDVSEDWPFYTDEERQAFRRRKPQNLTPPGSDGSTGSAASGHSSSSSHPASPQTSLKRSSAYLSSGDASPLSDHLAPPSSSPGNFLKLA